MGGAIKNVVERAVPDTSLQVLPGAGIANVEAVDTGKADLAFANSVSTVDAINGKPPFEEAVTNVCHVATLYPQYFQIVTTADTGIESLDQLTNTIGRRQNTFFVKPCTRVIRFIS